MTLIEEELQRGDRARATYESDYWITPIKATSVQTAERTIESLAGDKSVYAFGPHAHGIRILKPGDWICFYIAKRGVVGHAKIVSRPQRIAHDLIPNPERYPWIVTLECIQLYLDRPVRFDIETRKALEAFNGREEEPNYGWFVRSTHRISVNDFHVLTRNSTS